MPSAAEGAAFPKEVPSSQAWQSLDSLKAHTDCVCCCDFPHVNVLLLQPKLLPGPWGGDTASCLTGAGWGTAAAGWNKKRASGYEGMVAGGQGLGSWATASSCLRDLARQPASQYPVVGEGVGGA